MKSNPDRTLGIITLILETYKKHFKIDEAMDCVDRPVSITEGQMQQLVGQIRWVEKIFGAGELGVRRAEKETTVFRKYSSR